jgi:hypothetical protein
MPSLVSLAFNESRFSELSDMPMSIRFNAENCTLNTKEDMVQLLRLLQFPIY